MSPPISAQVREGVVASGTKRPERPQKVDISRGPTRPGLAMLSVPVNTTSGCDPETVEGVCPGTYSFSYSAAAKQAPRDGGAQSQNAGMSLSIYATKRVFFDLSNRNVVSRKTSTDRRTGFGDIALSAGADVLLEKSGRPGVSLIYTAKLPSADSSKGLGTGHTDHGFIAAISKSVGKASFELDLGHYLSGEGNGKFSGTPSISVIMVHPLDADGRYKLYMEAGGDLPANGERGAYYTFDYLQRRLSKNVALRIGGTIGLSSNSPRSGLYVGLKVNGRT